MPKFNRGDMVQNKLNFESKFLIMDVYKDEGQGQAVYTILRMSEGAQANLPCQLVDDRYRLIG